MAVTYIPITLTGDTLGSRHYHLNSLVNDAYQKSVDFNTIKDVTEKSPIDRIFKIDLASKYKNVDYILQTLKDNDMLYVSRALKSFWLLDHEYRNIIEPVYLEDILYPEMITTAVNKMKHWIEINLKDPQRCEEFYRYYIVKGFDMGIKFLWNCPTETILEEFSKIEMLEALTPHRFKLLCEKCPAAAKKYFDSLNEFKNVSNIDTYTKKKEFSEALKVLLKKDGDIYLDIVEKYCFNSGTLTSEATKHILKYHKERFEKKPELYASRFLNIKMLAKYLNQTEIKDLILKLARAQYLHSWFNYKNIEPLIKALSHDERTAFKKRVFVDKDIGEMVKEWSYDIPERLPVPEGGSALGSIFEDSKHNPSEYNRRFLSDYCDRSEAIPYCAASMMRRKTSLDELFDSYRFVSFEKTLFELRKKMTVDSSKHRQYMMLVLISKSGGKAESVEQLLTLLTSRYANEPENMRATVIRSLVRRCSAWRLPQHIWELLVCFGRGLGLDGSPAALSCKEGLHAVLIRNILHDTQIDSAVWKAYMNDFSTLTEYTLNAAEKQIISTKLPELLLAAAKSDVTNAVDRLEKTLDVLEAYKISASRNDNLIQFIAETATKNEKAKTLILRLFEARISRKELFEENFKFMQNNASYLNALKHNTSVLIKNDSFTALIKSNNLAHDRFLKSLSLYFYEENGLAQKYLLILLNYANEAPKEELIKKNLARSIAILSGAYITQILNKFNDMAEKSERRRFSALLRSNCHLTRPAIDIEAFGRQSIGAKAIANRVLTCSKKDVDDNLQSLLAWTRTQKLAIILSTRVGKASTVLELVGHKRPRQALKTILRHAERQKLDDDIWDVIISLIAKLDSAGEINSRLCKALFNVKVVPDNKKAKYCTTSYEIIHKTSDDYAAMPMLCNIENILHEVDDSFIENVINRYLDQDFTPEKLKKNDYTNDICVKLEMRIIARYLLLCKSETDIERKWALVGEPFFDKCEIIWKEWNKNKEFLEYLNDFLLSLKFTKVFLDTSYAPCLIMFEQIINRLQKLVPIHEHYEVYIKLHLTMLYFKTIRQSVKHNPAIFVDLPNNLEKATEIVGRIFGKYIAHEVIELIDKYFESIKHIYKKVLVDFLGNYFPYGLSKNVVLFKKNIIKGILDGDNKSHVLAEHIYKGAYHCTKEDREEMMKVLEESSDLELKFFLNAHKKNILAY